MNKTKVDRVKLAEALKLYMEDRMENIVKRREALVVELTETRKGFFQLGAYHTREEAESMVNEPDLWWQGGYWDKRTKELTALCTMAADGQPIEIDGECAEWLSSYWSE